MIDHEKLDCIVSTLIEERDFYYGIVQELRTQLSVLENEPSSLLTEKVGKLSETVATLEEKINNLKGDLVIAQEERKRTVYTAPVSDEERNVIQTLRTEFDLKTDEPSTLLYTHVQIMKETVFSLQEKVEHLKSYSSLHSAINVRSEIVQEILKPDEKNKLKPDEMNKIKQDIVSTGENASTMDQDKTYNDWLILRDFPSTSKMPSLQNKKNEKIEKGMMYSEIETLQDKIADAGSFGEENVSSVIARIETGGSLKTVIKSKFSSTYQWLVRTFNYDKKNDKENKNKNENENENEKQKSGYKNHSTFRTVIAGSILLGVVWGIGNHFFSKRVNLSENLHLEYVLNIKPESLQKSKHSLRETEKESFEQKRKEEVQIKNEQKKVTEKEMMKIYEKMNEVYSLDFSPWVHNVYLAIPIGEDLQPITLDKKELSKSKSENIMKSDDRLKVDDKIKVASKPVVVTTKRPRPACGANEVKKGFQMPANWNSYHCLIQDITEKEKCYDSSEYLPEKSIIDYNHLTNCSANTICCPPK